MRSWDSKAYEYKIVDSVPSPDVSELDEYVFVVRKRVGKCSHALICASLTCPSDKKTGEVIAFVDIKSPGLRDILRDVLKDIKTAGLETDRPAVLWPLTSLEASFANGSIRSSGICCTISFQS
jgi:hypothetical protein